MHAVYFVLAKTTQKTAPRHRKLTRKKCIKRSEPLP